MEDALLVVFFMPQNELFMRTFAKEGLMVEEGRLNTYLSGRNKQIKAKCSKETDSFPQDYLLSRQFCSGVPLAFSRYYVDI